jgi:hypothetical protein
MCEKPLSSRLQIKPQNSAKSHVGHYQLQISLVPQAGLPVLEQPWTMVSADFGDTVGDD